MCALWNFDHFNLLMHIAIVHIVCTSNKMYKIAIAFPFHVIQFVNDKPLCYHVMFIGWNASCNTYDCSHSSAGQRPLKKSERRYERRGYTETQKPAASSEWQPCLIFLTSLSALFIHVIQCKRENEMLFVQSCALSIDNSSGLLGFQKKMRALLARQNNARVLDFIHSLSPQTFSVTLHYTRFVSNKEAKVQTKCSAV